MIAYIGGFTALLAAVIAVQQDDIKRILAYSTLSQLGYMVMAVGLHGPTPAMFHLTTHAFFKALLFLGSGSVIIGLHHEQNIWKMGGLRKKMPVTFWTFLFGTLALTALWPFSGFFSKDSIIAQAADQGNYLLFAVGLFVAVLTAFYMFRLIFVVFYGSAKSDHAEHAHETPPVMTWPLRILAVFSLIGGCIGVEGIYVRNFWPDSAEHAATFAQQLFEPFKHSMVGAMAWVGGSGRWFLCRPCAVCQSGNGSAARKIGRFRALMRNRFYFDEIYEATVIRAARFAGGNRWRQLTGASRTSLSASCAEERTWPAADCARSRLAIYRLTRSYLRWEWRWCCGSH